MKKQNLVLTVGFCLLLAGMQAAFWLLPKQSFSENEKRVLQEVPSFSLSSLWSGRWFQSMDSYFSDHFAGRDFWVGMHAYANQLEGLNAAGEIYRGKDGWLLHRPVEAGDIWEQNLQTLSDFAEQHHNLTMLCIPTTGAVMTDKLPALHDRYPDQDLLAALQQSCDGMQWVDLLPMLAENKDAGVYYRTDHHWTSYGAYLGYCALARAWGLDAAAQTDYQIQTHDGFYGTAYSESGLWATAPDSIALWTDPAVQIHTTIYDQNIPAPIEQEGVFFREHLEQADQYPVFLDGNHARVTLTSDAPGGKLLVVRDSFAHCLAPFFSRHFQTVDLIDLRYFKEQTISQLIEQNQYDRVLFVFGLDTLTSDRSLQWLE